MISYVTYQSATFASRAAFEAAKANAEAAGWYVSSINRRGQRFEVLFGIEQNQVEARLSLPKFSAGAAGPVAAAPRVAAGNRLRRLFTRKPATSMQPVVRGNTGRPTGFRN